LVYLNVNNQERWICAGALMITHSGATPFSLKV